MISAKVICDSVGPKGNRLTTFELRYPKFIHGELMTHRVFSRNASSSRAIPTEKLIAEVRSEADRAAPVFWGANQKGMQANAELIGDAYHAVRWQWSMAAKSSADWAEAMVARGAHKQIVNRVLEPFSHINVVVTATEYLNFFGLRLDKAAQPEMRFLANAMWEAYVDSAPHRCDPDVNWHLPYFEPDDWAYLEAYHDTDEKMQKWMMGPGQYGGSYAKDLAIAVSVARCARVSYKSFETGRRSTVAEDLELYERLLGAQPLHASPAEHQATPDLWRMNRLPAPGCWSTPHEHGNFVGWRQYRKMLIGESCAPLPDGYHLSN